MNTWLKRLIGFIFFGIVIWFSGSYVGSIISTRGNPVPIPAATQYFTESVKNVEFIAKDGVKISAWFLADSSNEKAVVLLNGLRGNRLGMVERAKIYREKGYAVLLPDLRGTGDSQQSLITFGWKERWDLQASIYFLQKTGYQNIAVHGMSLGAATIVFSLQENPNYSFVVLESCYDNIDQALANRVERFHLPEFLFRPLKWITEWRIGVPTKSLYPENFLNLSTAPTLIMAGDAEMRVRKDETEQLYRNCSAEKKQIHFFAGAKHEDFINKYEAEFKDLMDKWLNQMGE